jgi:hypothetical protein
MSARLSHVTECWAICFSLLCNISLSGGHSFTFSRLLEQRSRAFEGQSHLLKTLLDLSCPRWCGSKIQIDKRCGVHDAKSESPEVASRTLLPQPCPVATSPFVTTAKCQMWPYHSLPTISPEFHLQLTGNKCQVSDQEQEKQAKPLGKSLSSFNCSPSH